MTVDQLDPDESKERSDANRRLFAACAFFGAALYLSLSFVSYDGLSDASHLSPFANLGGKVGFYVADQLLATFGAGAFALSFFLMYLGYAFLTRRPLENLAIKILGSVLCAATLAVTLQAIAPSDGYARSAYPLGGVLGDWGAARMLVWFGGLGSTLILTLLLIASAVITTDTLFRDLGLEIWNSGNALVARLRRPPLSAAADGVGVALAGASTAGLAPADVDIKPRRLRGASAAEALEALSGEATAELDEDTEEEEEEWDEDAEIDRLLGNLEIDEEEIPILGAADEEEEEESEEAEEEDEEEEEDWGDLDEDEELEEEVDEDEVEPSAPPIIRARRKAASDDQIEIISFSREKHLIGKEPYPLPPLTLLGESDAPDDDERDAEIARKARTLEDALRTFKIEAKVVEITRGPTITVYEMSLAAGTKVSRITSLGDDISMALKARTIRIVAPIPGKATVGIEVPNDVQERVSLRELAMSDQLQKKHFAIPLLLGKDASGKSLIVDLTELPHLLVAGQTGSGKSVCLNSIIISLLLTKYPEEVRLILIDPKMVELQSFRNLPHLMTPVVTDMKKAPKILEWAVNAMDERYELLAAVSARNIKGYNKLGEETVRERLLEHYSEEELVGKELSLPYIVLVVDELADLMMTSAKEVENSICRLAQKSRAVGIHVVLATQRPSVDVITGLIKSNMPSRISFRVSSAIDSRTILDQKGAERLLGRGDMLMTDARSSSPVRCQAALVTDEEIRDIVNHIKNVAKPAYSPVLTQVSSSTESNAKASGKDRDPLYQDAIRAVLQSQRGSVSMLQRKLEIGYTRAARLVDFMAEDGIVGSFKGSKAREVTMTLEDWEQQEEAS